MKEILFIIVVISIAYALHRHNWIAPRFRVLDKNGNVVEANRLIDEDWVKGELTITSEDDVWFAVDDQGGLYLLDSCGNYVHCPSDYRVSFRS